MGATITKPKMVSLFSGCGGLDLGFEKAGFDIIWANDFDADAQAVYRLNLGELVGRTSKPFLTRGAEKVYMIHGECCIRNVCA